MLEKTALEHALEVLRFYGEPGSYQGDIILERVPGAKAREALLNLVVVDDLLDEDAPPKDWRGNRFLITHAIQIQCPGLPLASLGTIRRYTLAEPVTVTIMGVVDPEGIDAQITVGPEDCPHCGGGHGDKCLVGDQKLHCPFSFDWPYVKRQSGWKIPHLIQPLMQELERELVERLAEKNHKNL